MTTARANIADLLDPRFSEIYFKSLAGKEPVYDKIFNIKTSDRKYEMESGISGFGLAIEKEEGKEIYMDDPKQKYDKTYTHTTYALGFRVTQEALEDDLSGSLARMPSELANSMSKTVETLAAQHFDRSQNSSYTGPDSKVLCATDHPCVGGGTFSNRPTTNADLSVTVLESALAAMRITPNDRGLIQGLMPSILLIPPALEWTAKQLLVNENKAGTSNRDINAIKDRGLKYLIWEDLTDTDSWYLLVPKGEHQLNFFWRRKINFKSDNDFHTDDGLFKSSMRISSGWVDARGIYGSIGA